MTSIRKIVRAIRAHFPKAYDYTGRPVNTGTGWDIPRNVPRLMRGAVDPVELPEKITATYNRP